MFYCTIFIIKIHLIEFIIKISWLILLITNTYHIQLKYVFIDEIYLLLDLKINKNTILLWVYWLQILIYLFSNNLFHYIIIFIKWQQINQPLPTNQRKGSIKLMFTSLITYQNSMDFLINLIMMFKTKVWWKN